MWCGSFLWVFSIYFLVPGFGQFKYGSVVFIVLLLLLGFSRFRRSVLFHIKFLGVFWASWICTWCRSLFLEYYLFKYFFFSNLLFLRSNYTNHSHHSWTLLWGMVFFSLCCCLGSSCWPIFKFTTPFLRYGKLMTRHQRVLYLWFTCYFYF
jgi:hypothetical protein